MTEATYKELMEAGKDAEDRGDFSVAYHLYGLALQTQNQNGGSPLGAIIRQSLVARKASNATPRVH